jgi:hypothetical protein
MILLEESEQLAVAERIRKKKLRKAKLPDEETRITLSDIKLRESRATKKSENSFKLAGLIRNIRRGTDDDTCGMHSNPSLIPIQTVISLYTCVFMCIYVYKYIKCIYIFIYM